MAAAQAAPGTDNTASARERRGAASGGLGHGNSGGKKRRTSRSHGTPYRRPREALWLLAPAVLVLALVVGYPMFFLVRLSFSEWTDVQSGMQWVGFDNYAFHLAGASDFWHSTAITLIFVLTAVTIEMILGFGLALLVQEVRRGRGPIRTLFLVPIVMTPIVAALTWQTLIYNPTAGIGTWLIGLLDHPPIAWLAGPDTSLAAVIAVEVWHWTPLVILMLLAGLVSVPRELYDAARADGANRWQTWQYITLPSMIPVITVALALRTIDAFRTFDMVFALTGGGPGTSTLTLPLFVYRTGFQFLHMGEGAAAAVMLILLSAGVVALLLFVLGRVRARA